MDTSETYIKQSDCPEIQGVWEPASWDWVFCKTADEDDENPVVLSGYQTDGGFYGHEAPDNYKDGECSSPVSNGDYPKRRNFKADHIWLPIQSQLQAMVGDFGKCQDIMHAYLSSRVGCPMSELWPSPLYSMEQLWLAFVMKEKFGKVWSGEKWSHED